MQLFYTENLPEWPGDVLLGWETISPQTDTSILSEEELKNYNDFTHHQRKDEFLTARHLFRFMVAEVGIKSDQMQLLKEESGKPYAMNGEEKLHVSFSHSKSLVMCAISPIQDIGLDIEMENRTIKPEIIRRFLNINDWDAVGTEDPIRLWTIKEAAVKCLGTGFRTNLNELELANNKGPVFSAKVGNNTFNVFSFSELNHHIALAYKQ